MPTTTHKEILILEISKIKKETTYNKNYYSMNSSMDSSTNQKKIIPFDNGTNQHLFLKHDSFQAYQTVSLEDNAVKTICQNDFCCDFKVEIAKVDPNTNYRLVIFNGDRFYGNVKAGIRTCGIVQCLNNSVSSCGSVQKSETIFNNIEITATFHDYKNSLIMPSVLNPDLLPLKGWTFLDHTHHDHMHVNMFSNKRTNNLVTFGIYSRNFNQNNANKTSFYTFNYFVMLLITLLLSKL